MAKFHHNKVIDVITKVLSYSTVAFILFSCVSLLVHIYENGAPSSFGIYG